MGESLVHTDSEVWVELKHSVQKINAFGASSWVLVLHVHSIIGGETLQVSNSLGICDVADIFIVWCSKNIKDHCKLVITSDRETIGLDTGMSIWGKWEARLTREEWLTVHVSRCTLLHHTEKLSEDAAYRPHVNSLTVVFLQED